MTGSGDGRLQNFCGETVGAPGTGNIALTGAKIPGGQTFASRFANNQTLYYMLIDGSQVEVGVGQFLTSGGNQIKRSTVLFNSAGTHVPLSFPGVSTCWCELPAERAFYYDDHLNIGETFRTKSQTDWARLGQVVYTNAGAPSPLSISGGQYFQVPFDFLYQNTLGSISGAGPYTNWVIPSDGYYFISWKQGLRQVSGTSGGGCELALFGDSTMLKRVTEMATAGVQNFGSATVTGYGGLLYSGIEWFGFLAAGTAVTFNIGIAMLGPVTGGTGQMIYDWLSYGGGNPAFSAPGFGWINVGLCEAKITKHMG